MTIDKRDVTFKSGDSFAAGWFFLPEDAGSGAAVPAVAMAHGIGAVKEMFLEGAHHPHLQAGTAGDWPLNVFDEKQAAAELPTLRAIASADLHNLVFQRDYRIIPAIIDGWAPRQPAR